MENIILQKTRYLKALMLTMLVGLFAFEGVAQITVTEQPDDALTHYVGQDSVVSFDATSQLPETGNIYLYTGTTFNAASILDTAAVANGQTLNFTWPTQGNYELRLIEAFGTLNINSVPFTNTELDILGSNETGFGYTFDESGGRTVTTSAKDLTGEPVLLKVGITTGFVTLDDSLFVEYSTDGSNFTRIDTLDFNGTYNIELPAGAVSASTIFRISQENSSSLNADEQTWSLTSLSLEYGEPLNTSGSTILGNYQVNLSEIAVTAINDDAGDPIAGPVYPRDTLTVIADALGFDKGDYNYVAYAEATIGGQTVTYQLEEQDVDLSKVDSILIEGSIPLNIPYDEDWNFYIKAFDSNDAEAVIGANYVENIEETQLSGSSTEYIMDGTDKTVESGVYLDPGGSGEYANNINNLTETLYPANPNGRLRLDFVFTVIEPCCDDIEIFDGTSIAAPSLGVFNSGNLPGTIEATNSEGALTIRFNSDGSVTEKGWHANISTLVSEGNFFSDGERAYTTEGYVITSTNGELFFDLEALNNSIYPDGTEIEIQYSTDSVSFTTLAEVDMNQVGPGGSSFVYDEWPVGVVSNSTYFRFKQKNNNGERLNGWEVSNISIDVNSNIVNGSLFDYQSSGLITISQPDIQLDVYDLLANGKVFPGATIDLSYTIQDGAFPAGTEIEGIFERNDLAYDIILGSSATLDGTLEASIPAVAAGSYTVYLSANGAESNSFELPISGIDIQIDSIVGNPEVLYQGADYVYPGSDITSYYTLLGSPGAGVELLLQVEDATLDEYITIGTASTFSGSISATLPDSIDYSGNYQLVLSDGQSLLGNLVTLADQPFFNTNLSSDIFSVVEGNNGGLSSLFIQESVRSATTVEYNIENGAQVYLRVYSQLYLGTPYNVDLQVSQGGGEWITFDEITVNGNNSYFDNGNVLVPVELWSDSARFRVISNEDEAFGFNENRYYLTDFTLQAPEKSELSLDMSSFNIILPELAMETIVNANSLIVGEEITIDFNATGPFPTDTWIAAVIENQTSGEYMLIGEAEATEIGEITGTLPLTLETMAGAGDPYDQIKIVPYVKTTAETQYQQGLNIDIEDEEDFLVVEGDDAPVFGASFDLDFFKAGNRSALTKAYDLSVVSSASIDFTFSDVDNSFDMDGNLNVVPRLQVSVDGGASFEEIAINETNEAEGLLFESTTYSVDIPSEYLTEATHFRWYQPLNLGVDTNEWSISSVSIELGENNALNSFYDVDEVEQPVTLKKPSLAGYEWMQDNLEDPVFNGESFDYSWDFDPEADSTLYEDFPAGTQFVFTLDGVTDLETDEELIIGTSSSLGVASANIPLYVENGSYTVNVAAFIEVGEMEYPYYDFSDDQFAGTLDVFNQVLETTFDGNPNDVYYAGNEVTVNYAFENDITSSAINDLQYNLILEYGGDRWLLAVDESFTGSFTVDMPPFVTGAVDFVVEASEGGPLGTVGEILDLTSIDLNDADSWINEEVALVDSNVLPGSTGTAAELADVAGRRVLTTTDFDLVAENAARLSFDLTVNNSGSQIDIDDVLVDQQLIFEYSTDGGATYTELETFFTEGDENGLVDFTLPRRYELDGDILTASTRFRFRQEESRFTIFIQDMEISEAGKAQIDYVSAGNNGFASSISKQSIQVTSIEGDDACLSDEVTLNYEIRGKFGADNKVMVEYGVDPDFRSDQISVAANQLQFLVGQDNATTGNYPVEFTENSNYRRVYTPYFDLSGGSSAEVTIDVSTFSNLNKDVDVYVNTSGVGTDYLGTISSTGVYSYTVNPSYIGSNTRFYLFQGNSPLDGEDVWKLNGIEIDLFGSQPVEGFEFDITEGNGTLAVQLPSDLFASGESNKDLKFRLVADDDTFESLGVSYEGQEGTFSETSIEIVAPLNADADFNNNLIEIFACENEDVMVEINANNMQDYFLYEVLNAADGTVLGSLVRDPEDYQNEINIGAITASTDLELRVTAQSSAGNSCNTLVTDEVKVEVLYNLELYSQLNNIDQSADLVVAGDELTTCANANTITLSLARLREDGTLGNGNPDLVEWFRDDLNNLVASGPWTIGDDNEIEVSGAYFARVTTGSCVYTTESIQINIVETPDQPVVTVVSGDLTACSSADPVVLAAPEGFAYYRWNGNNNLSTRTITADNTNSSYSVEVSNVPFGTGCSSDPSASVDVTRYDTPEFAVSLNSNTVQLIGEGEVLNVCAASDRIYFLEDGSYGNNGIVQVIKDGENYATVENTSSIFDITESGVYSFVWNYNSLNVEGCTSSSVEFTINLNDAVDVTPTIAVTGDLNSCDPENEVTLEGPEGFANYVWSRNGTQLTSNSRTITVSQTGDYTLEVSNTDLDSNCGLSNESSPVVVNIAPDPDDYSLRLNGGLVSEGEEVELCSSNQSTIRVYRSNSTNLQGATVKWFRDGAEITPNFDSNNNVLVTESGVYNAEVKVGQCVVETYAVTLTVIVTPDAPTLTSTGTLSFCEGEGTVTLTAPAGFEYYTWYDGPSGNDNLNTATNGLANSNVIEVSTSGIYTVTVSNSANGCASARSNPIVVDVVDEPIIPAGNNFQHVNTTCGDGAAEFEIENNNSSAMTYQLYNGETGQASGNPVTIQGGQTGSIFTEVLSETGIPFYVEVMYADGTGCSNVDPSQVEEAEVRTITLEVEGATLMADYSTSGVDEVRWYRDGVRLNSASGSDLTITDAAEYTIEVEYDNGCVLTASSADIDGRVLANREGMDMKVTSYPNPTLSDVTLNVNSQYMGKHEVIITSMTGQVMMQSSFEKSSFEAEHEMNVANLEEGIYNVQIRYDGLTQNVRIIKK